jgi:hypothetical protein
LIHPARPSSAWYLFPVTLDDALLFKKFEGIVEYGVRKSVNGIFLLESADDFAAIRFSSQKDGKNVTNGQFFIEINRRGVLKELINVVKSHLFNPKTFSPIYPGFLGG